jgi:hypothetical protein
MPSCNCCNRLFTALPQRCNVGPRMNLWEERVARNEALFREVNERVEELHDDLSGAGMPEFVCECPDDACTERISVPIEVYERVRRDPHLFLLRSGHDQSEVEQVVEQADGFVIVRKDTPTTERIAEQTDPRA